MTIVEWMNQNREALVWLTVASAVVFVGSLVVCGVVIVRLPADHFRKSQRSRERDAKERDGRHPGVGLALRVIRNIVGWVLILAGLAMLVLPGQGMLALLIGIMLADFPGKYRVERWVISRKKVLGSLNWLRTKFGRPPLQLATGIAPAG